MPDDKNLQTMVMDELAWMPEIDAAGIGVSAHKGVVTLTGIVSTLAEKHAVERAARRVRGVRALAQDIVVQVPDAHKTSDAEIAERVVRILNWDVHVPHDQIQVKVENGVVTLTGAVSYPFQAARGRSRHQATQRRCRHQ